MNSLVLRVISVVTLLVLGAAAGPAPAAGVPGTPAASENPLYHGALPWELPDDAEKMVVHSVTDGDTVRLTYPNDDWYYNTRIIGIQVPKTIKPGEDFEAIIISENYIQSVYDVAIAFGYSPGKGFPGSLGQVADSFYLGPGKTCIPTS